MTRWLPENIASYGHHVDGVIQLIFVIVGSWFVLSFGLLLFFAIRYRKSNHPRATYLPAHGKTLLYVLAPVVVILLLDFVIEEASTEVWDLIKIEQPTPDQVIGIVGKQYVWEFAHPGIDGALGTDDDIETLNTLHVPVDAVVQFELGSKDVIHSFFVPNLRLKQDAVPGRTILGWFKATKEGRYQIVCAELCGLGHTNMRGWLEVHSEESYRNWVRQESEDEL